MTDILGGTKAGRALAVTPARIASLPNLPLFHKLQGRKVVVAGSSQGALWKAELLSASGADVLVLADHEVGASLYRDLAARPVSGPVTILPREWTEEDLDGAALAVADIADRDAALRFVAAAHAAGAPANLIDQTDLCDVQFGTIVNRSPVVLAISTDGGAPMLGQSIRARVESVLPLGLSGWAKAAQKWRPLLKQRFRSFQDRRAFWQRFTALAWANVDRDPVDADFGALVGGVNPEQRNGIVTLVGAGPGDPELLTLKAVRALQSATVILYDDLVGPAILELARREAQRVAVGKTGHGPSCSQAEINRRIISLAEAGENVVRLKGGDPLVFGRATEEVDACRAAGIEVRIVPGISAAQGAAASLGFSLTERDQARRVQYVTGHDTGGDLPATIEWKAVADPDTTTVIYMPRKTLEHFTAKAIAAGLDPETPAVAVASATTPDQGQVSGTAATIASFAADLPAGAPVIVILGRVARERPALATDLPEYSQMSLAS
ncbi:siroheme synthase CysG [Sphingosinicella rhizophila]|uniref:Siroheme synthase CysG n=1 Tax=Sphingosinicella rhizophila TaxID=3050082 RepID=A0ABU3Q1V0_9SPHN|nr:siroheme synthase CysG [Sphingosinicella sp. GR2756]MDT9597395.1 siroheme synthase CysG [Sphingosinicella sp. GR2756]